MMPRLELWGLVKRFDRVTAVDGLDLSLDAGEFVALLGPSGCGKSTTLAMVVGFEAPTAGDIRVDGRSVVGLPPRARRIGLVFQDYALFSRHTVRANVVFGLEAQGLPRAERTLRLDAIVEQLDLGSLLQRRAGELNMSEMQRVALARVLITEPELLLLDEPMSNLDASTRATLRSELKLIQKRLGQTVLYVTHDQVEAMAMSDRIAVMNEGRIEQIGTPDEVFRRPATRFVAEFIGDIPVNLVPCAVHRSSGAAVARTALHKIPVPMATPDGRHLIALRPHDVRAGHKPFNGSAPATVRFVENLGAEHVLHVEYGEMLLALTTEPGFATPGERVHIGVDPAAAHVVLDDGRVLATVHV